MWAIHAERAEATALAQLSGVIVAQALGAEVAHWPTVGAALADMDAQLAAEPKLVDTHEQQLREALGLGVAS